MGGDGIECSLPAGTDELLPLLVWTHSLSAVERLEAVASLGGGH